MAALINDLGLALCSQESYDRANVWSGNSCAQITKRSDSIIIAFRGTNDPIDIMADLWAIPWKPKEVGAWVHRGFWLYLSPLVDPIFHQIDACGLPIYLTGHSLGGASACIFAAMCRRRGLEVENLTTFGSPRAGSDSLANQIWDIPGKRFVIEGDQVASVPPGWLFPYVHDRQAAMLPGIDGPIDHPVSGYVDALRTGVY